MFGKKKNGGPTVVGAGSEIEGSLRAPDGLQVDGAIQGSVDVSGGMSVGPSGVIRGEVRADSAAIAGRVEGTLTVDGHLHLLATGVLEGEIGYGTLAVDKGGQLSGRTAHIDTTRETSDAKEEEEEEEKEEVEELIGAAAKA